MEGIFRDCSALISAPKFVEPQNGMYQDVTSAFVNCPNLSGNIYIYTSKLMAKYEFIVSENNIVFIGNESSRSTVESFASSYSHLNVTYQII